MGWLCVRGHTEVGSRLVMQKAGRSRLCAPRTGGGMVVGRCMDRMGVPCGADVPGCSAADIGATGHARNVCVHLAPRLAARDLADASAIVQAGRADEVCRAARTNDAGITNRAAGACRS